MDIVNISADAQDFTGNVWKLENEDTCLIDAGTGDSWEKVSELSSVDKVVVTHSHYDHVDNIAKVVNYFSPDVYAYNPSNLEVDAEKLNEGDVIELSGLEFKVFHTPGHKDDSLCLFNEENGLLFAGDLVFPDGGFGRTDLAEGNRDVLIRSIKKIVELDVKVFYPGHGDAVGKNASNWLNSSLEEAMKHKSKY